MTYNWLKTDKVGWIVRITSCLIFFAFINVFLLWYFAGREADFYNARAGLRMKYFNKYELEAAVQKVAQDKGPKIVVLGDSFVWGTGVDEKETFSERLEQYISKKTGSKHYNVYNLGIPASNAADVYAVLKKVGPLKPDLIIVNTNYFFFSVSERLVHMNYPWLVENFKNEPEKDKLINSLNIMTPEFRIGELVRRAIPLYRYREEINIKLLGTNKPQNKFSDILNSLVLKGRWTLGLEKNWKPKIGKESGEKLAWAYSPDPVTPQRANYVFSDKIAAYLKKNNLNAVILLTPHNNNVVGKYMEAEGFKKNSKVIKNIFTQKDLPFFEYEDRLDDRYHADHIHLTSEGSKVFAELLGKDVLPYLDGSEES